MEDIKRRIGVSDPDVSHIIIPRPPTPPHITEQTHPLNEAKNLVDYLMFVSGGNFGTVF